MVATIVSRYFCWGIESFQGFLGGVSVRQIGHPTLWYSFESPLKNHPTSATEPQQRTEPPLPQEKKQKHMTVFPPKKERKKRLLVFLLLSLPTKIGGLGHITSAERSRASPLPRRPCSTRRIGSGRMMGSGDPKRTELGGSERILRFQLGFCGCFSWLEGGSSQKVVVVFFLFAGDLRIAQAIVCKVSEPFSFLEPPKVESNRFNRNHQ